MARVTVEDCLPFVENRFELVILASKRARQLERGKVDPLVPAGNDKPTVLALREIAAGKLSKSMIEAAENQSAEQQKDFAEPIPTTELIEITEIIEQDQL